MQNEISPLDVSSLKKIISYGGKLDSISESFEERPSQIKLLEAITNTFNNSKIGVFEAGTGVGKSYAYLLPAMLWSVQNKERVVITTGTINLQQQLFEKDIPFAEKLLNKKVNAVIVKGRQNYICKRRFLELKAQQDLFSEEINELSILSSWINTTKTGCKSDLSFVPSESLWYKICSESDSCLGNRCTHFNECFVMQMRKMASEANILVVNHHLFFADIESRLSGIGYEDNAVLPPFKRVVIDEAHGMEDAATSFFSSSFTKFAILKQLNYLYRERHGSCAGYILTLEALSSRTDLLEKIQVSIEDIKLNLEKLNEEALIILGRNYNIRLHEKTSQQFENIFLFLKDFQESLATFITLVKQIIEGIPEDCSDDMHVWETKQILKRLENISSMCKEFLKWTEHDDMVFWIEKCRAVSAGTKNAFVNYARFIMTPIDISEKMVSGVFETLDSVVCTSATLRIHGNFSFWFNRVGISKIDKESLFYDVFDSPFSYKTNLLLEIPTDAPSPDTKFYQDYINKTVCDFIKIADGRTLVLFTSYDSLRNAYDYAINTFVKTDITVLKQGDEDRFKLLNRFKTDKQSVLFATDSFWEGVDVPGESLSQVIIIKLPFTSPGEPIFAARSEDIDRKGGNSFINYSIPEAVIKLRQGFGRLMRCSTDRGCVIILDNRIITKKYGKIFLESLPESILKVAPLSELKVKTDNFLNN